MMTSVAGLLLLAPACSPVDPQPGQLGGPCRASLTPCDDGLVCDGTGCAEGSDEGSANYGVTFDFKDDKAAVQADMKEARGFGITGTPGFMINGRVLTGAQPLEAFEKIIDEELALKGIEIPPKPQAAAANSGETATQ